MRYLGIDYGSKRVGLAISDQEGLMAFPLVVLSNDKDVLLNIKNIIDKEEIGKIVIGESNNFDGKPNKISKDIEKFIIVLETETKLPIVSEPEFLSSHQAERWQGKNENLDASAAAIILQSFLDRSRS